MIDTFSGEKLDQINKVRATQQKNHFYPQHTRMGQPQTMAAAAQQSTAAAFNPREETKSVTASSKASKMSKASRARDSDGLDSVSQVSVTTPKSVTQSQRMGDSVSYTSAASKTTTQSTKQKLLKLE